MVVGNKMLTETHSISGYLYKIESSSSIVGEGGYPSDLSIPEELFTVNGRLDICWVTFLAT